LAVISKGEFDWSKLIVNGEGFGKCIEEDIGARRTVL
jgi:hypothetical protein